LELLIKLVTLRSGTMTDPIPPSSTSDNPTTTAQISSFDHVVVELMEIKKDSDIYNCFVENRFTDAFSLLGLSDQEILGLTYDETDDDDNIIRHDKLLPMYVRSSLCHLTNFFKKIKQEKFGPLTEDDIFDTTRMEYKEFRVNGNSMQDPPPVQYPTQGGSTNTTTPLTRDQVMRLKATNFEKSIKQDKTQYQEIKYERNFYTWERSFMTTARSQQIRCI
jgi:hypothetical protein